MAHFRRYGCQRPPSSWSLIESFDRCAKPIYDLVEILRRQISMLGRTRDLLLPRLMSGQLTLLEAEEAVPASL